MRCSLSIVLIALGVASCSSPQDEARELGDRAFRMGMYHDALDAYRSIEEPDEEVLSLIEDARFQSIMQSARERVHVNEIQDALALLDYLEQERPGMPETADLRRQAYRRKGAELASSGERLLDDGFPEAAARTYREALRWNPENGDAQVGFAEAERQSSARAQRGERLYFEGLDDVMNGHRERAFTSFSHAAHLLGQDSRAQDRVEALAGELTTELVLQAQELLDADNLGGAWLVLSDARRLDPANLDAANLFAEVDAELEARRLLSQAEIHVLGGRLDQADALLAKVLDVTGDSHRDQVSAMSERAVFQRATEDYKFARACELDNQIVRAVTMYNDILRLTDGYGYEDLKLRVDNLQRRIDLAADNYAIALEAERALQPEEYRQALEDCLELAGDYKDALERYRRLND